MTERLQVIRRRRGEKVCAELLMMSPHTCLMMPLAELGQYELADTQSNLRLLLALSLSLPTAEHARLREYLPMAPSERYCGSDWHAGRD